LTTHTCVDAPAALVWSVECRAHKQRAWRRGGGMVKEGDASHGDKGAEGM